MLQSRLTMWFQPVTWLAASAVAGKYNEVLNIGDAAPAWKELEGVDGKRHSLADLADNCDLSRIATPTAHDLKRIEKYRRAIAALGEA